MFEHFHTSGSKSVQKGNTSENMQSPWQTSFYQPSLQGFAGLLAQHLFSGSSWKFFLAQNTKIFWKKANQNQTKDPNSAVGLDFLAMSSSWERKPESPIVCGPFLAPWDTYNQNLKPTTPRQAANPQPPSTEISLGAQPAWLSRKNIWATWSKIPSILSIHTSYWRTIDNKNSSNLIQGDWIFGRQNSQIGKALGKKHKRNWGVPGWVVNVARELPMQM